MIHKIFFDLDETLLHTEVNNDPGQECFVHKFDGSDKTYYTIFRPSALSLLAFARELVGNENVYALTTGTRDYAERLNEVGKFGWSNEQIIAREDIDAHQWYGAYGQVNCNQHKTLANSRNVLIDNLPSRENEKKMSLIGIGIPRYIKVDFYWGVNFPDDPFEEDVKEALTRLHNEG
jgi:FMN phosphatase YigB (HAD superfamily)